ncbi:hemagglutinin repeat-containing protein, partial [Neorhizobium sp. T786]|uniref:hemagglutinin repeat-containing protein n=1 Tax=Pseudorhizobium xiangyangii TaxID=2883104 RepID=UPI001CFFBD91
DLTAIEGDIYAGAYTDIFASYTKTRKSYLGGLIGSTKISNTVDKYATGTQALAALDLTLVSGNDTTLIGAQLAAGGDLSIDTGGDFSVQAAISSQLSEYFEQKLGLVTMTTVTENSFREAAILSTFLTGGSLSFNVGGKAELSVYDYAGIASGDLNDLYPQELLAIAGLELLAQNLADEYFYDKQVQLSPAFKALVAIALNVVMPGSGVGG